MTRIDSGVWARLLDRQVMLLWVAAAFLVIITMFFGQVLFPFFAAVVLAYLMDGMVRFIQRRHLPRIVAVFLVFGLFMLGVVFLFTWLIPLIVNQLTSLAAEVPRIMRDTQSYLTDVQAKYLTGIESKYIQELLPRITHEMEMKIGRLATQILGYLPSLLGIFFYLILVPFLILFFLKDKERILAWLRLFVPRERDLLMKVLTDVDRQIGNYIRGKFWEVLIMGGSSTILFLWLNTRFAVLLGILTGLSTLVPYLGVAVVTLPVVALAISQWGFTWAASKPIIAYGILQFIDGTILAPVILGISVRLHPTAIVFAILVCGAIWGYWGLFFGVPIAAGVKSLLDFAFPFVMGDGQRPETPAAGGNES